MFSSWVNAISDALDAAVGNGHDKSDEQPPPVPPKRTASMNKKDGVESGMFRPRTSSIRDGTNARSTMPLPTSPLANQDSMGVSVVPPTPRITSEDADVLSPLPGSTTISSIPRRTSLAGTTTPTSPYPGGGRRKMSLAQAAGAMNKNVSWLASIPSPGVMDGEGLMVKTSRRRPSLSSAISVESLRSAASVELGACGRVSPPPGSPVFPVKEGQTPKRVSIIPKSPNGGAGGKDINGMLRRMSKRMSGRLEFPSLMSTLGIDTTAAPHGATSGGSKGFKPGMISLKQVEAVQGLRDVLKVGKEDVAPSMEALQNALAIVTAANATASANVVGRMDGTVTPPVDNEETGLPAVEFFTWCLKRAVLPNLPRTAQIQYGIACVDVLDAMHASLQKMTAFPCNGDVDEAVEELKSTLVTRTRRVLSRPWCSINAVQRAVKILEKDPRFFVRSTGVWGSSKRARSAVKALVDDVDAEVARLVALIQAGTPFMPPAGAGCGGISPELRRQWLGLLDEIVQVAAREGKKMRLAGVASSSAVIPNVDKMKEDGSGRGGRKKKEKVVPDVGNLIGTAGKPSKSSSSKKAGAGDISALLGGKSKKM